jgi:hypothetical protein
MTILVALERGRYAAVASDSRCIRNGSTIDDSYTKTFRLGSVPVIGGVFGLQEYSYRQAPSVVNDLPLDSYHTLDELASRAKQAFEVEIASMDEKEAIANYRNAEIFLLGNQKFDDARTIGIRVIELRSDPSTKRTRGAVRQFHDYCV